MSTGVAVEAIGLSKSFKVRTERRTSLKERLVRGKAPAPEQFWALRDATFAVPKGGSLGLIGQNGSGKSTALKVLAGIYRPTAGQVRVNGSVSALLEVGAGFHPELTGRENIRLNATILGFTGREIDRMMDQIIEFADIGDHIDGPIKHYSSGMYVRLGFAVAVMVRPQILIVDEVIAVGDEEFQRKCYEHLYRLRRAGTTLVVVSHGMAQITDLCDEALWLESGIPRMHGPSRAVTKAYIDSVNASELARSRSNATAEEVEQEADPGLAPRRGSGELRVTDVTFLGEDGRPSDVLICGRPATVRLEYRCKKPLEGVIMGLGFDDRNGLTICGMNNSHRRFDIIPAGTGHMDFAADHLLLAAGLYSLRFQIYQPGHVIDVSDDCPELTVRSPELDMDGKYLQTGRWSVVDSAAAG